MRARLTLFSSSFNKTVIYYAIRPHVVGGEAGAGAAVALISFNLHR
jgi:hypothetical protein